MAKKQKGYTPPPKPPVPVLTKEEAAELEKRLRAGASTGGCYDVSPDENPGILKSWWLGKAPGIKKKKK